MIKSFGVIDNNNDDTCKCTFIIKVPCNDNSTNAIRISPNEVPLFTSGCDYTLLLNKPITKSIIVFTTDNVHVTIPPITVTSSTSTISNVCINVDSMLYDTGVVVNVSAKIFKDTGTYSTYLTTIPLTFTTTLDSPESLSPQSFGSGLSITNNWMAVGSPFYGDKVGLGREGNVWMFKLISGVWTTTSTLFVNTYGSFGSPIMLSADESRVAISARYEPIGGFTRVGRVYIYKKELDDTWTQEAIIDPPPADVTKDTIVFGQSIHIDNTWCIIGTNNTNSGSSPNVYVYKYNSGTNIWEYHSTLNAPALDQNSFYGYDLTMSDIGINKFLLISVPNVANAISKSGQIYVYKYNSGTNVWVQHQIIISPEPAMKGEFSTAIASYGDHMAASMPFYDSGGKVGRVYLYKYNSGIDLWEPNTTTPHIDPINPQVGSRYGYSLSMSDTRLLIGSSDYSPTLLNTLIDEPIAYLSQEGEVSLYTRTLDAWAFAQTLTPPQNQSGQKFGASLSTIDNAGVVAATGYNNNSGQITYYNY